jgi:sugar lactone lactonase YvrE
MNLKGSTLGATLALAAAVGLSSAPIGAAPTFAVYPYFQKPLPDLWVTGVVSGVCRGLNNDIIIVTQGFQTGGLASPEGVGGAIISGPGIGTASPSTSSPPVVEFNSNGNVVRSWGSKALVPANTPPPVGAVSIVGQNLNLPNGIHGCFVDGSGNVWLAGTTDGVVQKYSPDGSQMLLQIGLKFRCDNGTNGSQIPCTGTGGGNVGAVGTVYPVGTAPQNVLLNGPMDVAVDPGNGDIYVADGGGNHRVVVFDQNGNYKLQMGGGVGTGAGQFSSAGQGHPSCVVLPNNGLVYACDRGNDRINVYNKSGVFQTSIPVVPGTANAAGTYGSAGDIAFSPDAGQTWMYVSDGGNERVWIMNHSMALTGTPGAIMGSAGTVFGHDTGAFTFVDTITVDSLGNMYTGETTGGRRMQMFQVSGQ